jgi:hypothetical protein
MPDYDGDFDDDSDIPPIPGEGKCAIYKCEDSSFGDYCAKSNFKNAFNISINLYDICAENTECKIGGDPNEVFYNGTNVNSKCYSNELIKRYPGERCNLDSECVYPLNNPSSQFHKCKNGRCTGMDEDEICEDNTWCLAGYYCDKFSGKCKEQKEEGDGCSETKECVNDLICLNGKCEDKLFSLGNGQKVPEYENIEIKKRFCKSGEVIDNTCVSYNDIDNNMDNDKYLKCDFGKTCKYKVIGLSEQKEIGFKCPCGYNSEGVGYCPHFHDYWSEERPKIDPTKIEEKQKLFEEKTKEKPFSHKVINGYLFINWSCENGTLEKPITNNEWFE